MSFGASLSDIIIVVTFCKAIYRKCRDAGGEYDEISREVKGLHVVLRHLKFEVEAPESPLNRDRAVWGHQLAPIISDCDATLRQLDTIISKYGRLSSANNSPSSPRVFWDKVRFGSNELDQVGAIRVKLISHKTSLTLFLETIQLHQNGKMAMTLDNHGGQLDIILDKVDRIATRMIQANGSSIMTNYDDDDKEVWKQFRRELIAEGFSSDVLQQNKGILRAYIREIDQKGLLDEVTVDPRNPPTKVSGINPERWLEQVQSAPSEDIAPSVRSSNAASDDSSVKEMVIREDNMKFPPAMKFERPLPESRESEQRRRLGVPSQVDDRRRSEGSQPLQSPVPKLITSDERDAYRDTTGSSDEDSETESTPKREKSSMNGQVIRTTDVLAATQALVLRPPGSPTLSYRSHGSFGEEDAMRSIPQRPKKQIEFGSSPLQTGYSPNQPSPMLTTDRGGEVPRPEPIRLAPDEHGNEILPDAKWTRINRKLVSPEVLDQDRRRYEARPEFVAVLGVLSRSEIEDLAKRTAELRHARHLRHHPPAPPQQPPRPNQPQTQTKSIPIPVPIPININRNVSGRDTPSTDPSSYDSSSDSSYAPNSTRPRATQSFKKQQPKRGYQESDTGVPISGYPNPYGQPVPPPSPMWSPAQPNFSQPYMPVPSSAPTMGMGGMSGMGVRFPNSPPERGGHYTHDPYSIRSREPPRPYERERERSRDEMRPRDRDDKRDREREKDRKHHSHSSRHNSYSKGGNERGAGRGEVEKPKSRWKENLTAAGIGGAAVSLLNVLSEAAEGI